MKIFHTGLSSPKFAHRIYHWKTERQKKLSQYRLCILLQIHLRWWVSWMQFTISVEEWLYHKFINIFQTQIVQHTIWNWGGKNVNITSTPRRHNIVLRCPSFCIIISTTASFCITGSALHFCKENKNRRC